MDEVGRGPIAGPVTIAVCACSRGLLAQMPTRHPLVQDSKKITPSARTEIARQLRSDGQLRFVVASVSAKEINQRGISRALRTAVARGLARLGCAPSDIEIRLDGRLYAPKKYPRQSTIVRGDATEWIIGAASIVAKVHRDAYMVRQAKTFPRYGFERHKGYGTKDHYAALAKHGLSPQHRRSFLSRFV